MKNNVSSAFLIGFFVIPLLFNYSYAQDYAAFQDYRDRFFVFHSGQIVQVETLKVNDFVVTKDKVVYLNNQSDLMLYNDQGKEKMDYNAQEIRAKDGLVAYTSGPSVKIIHDNQSTNFTMNKGNYWVGDNLAFCEDSFNGIFKVFDQGKVKALLRGTFTSLTNSVVVGENIGVFRFAGNQYKCYWRGKTYEIITYSKDIDFKCGRDMMAFNDPINNSFVVFYQGEFYDVEDQHAQSFKVGDNLLAYKDASGNFKVFDPSHYDLPHTIASYGTDYYTMNDNVVGFMENGWLKYYSGGETMQIVNYEPQKWQIDEQHLVYLNQVGQLKAIMDGEEKNITTEKIADFQLYNDCIVITWLNKTSSVYWKGEMYDSY